MANSIIYLAKAGAGKTYFITHRLDKLINKRILYLTFTNDNARNLKEQLLDQNSIAGKSNCDFFEVETFDIFLWKEFIKPFEQSIILEKGLAPLKGIDYKTEPSMYTRKNQKSFWQNEKTDQLYSKQRISAIMETSCFEKGMRRLHKYFDFIVIDEFQDICKPELNLLIKMTKCNFNLVLVGDLYQSYVVTTNRRRLPYAKKDYVSIGEEEFLRKKAGFLKRYVTVDVKTLETSYRVTPDVCSWIRNKLGISIESQSLNSGKVEITPAEDVEQRLKQCDKILVWDIVAENKVKKVISALNDDKLITWGKSKGLTYKNVCIILTKSTVEFIQGKKKVTDLKSINKFYVALTRSLGDVYLINPDYL